MNQQTNKLTSATLQSLASTPDAASKGTQQYLTPYDYAEALAIPLTYTRPVITDLHCGDGALASAAANDTTTHLLGHDIDPTARITKHPDYPLLNRSTIHNDITQTYQLLKNTICQFDLLTLNPPFSLRWKLDDLPTLRGTGKSKIKGDYITSTHATIRMTTEILSSQGEALILCNASTYQRLRDQFPDDFKHLWLALTMPCFFPGVSKQHNIAVLYFAKWHTNTNEHHPTTPHITPETAKELTDHMVKIRSAYRPIAKGLSDSFQRNQNTTLIFEAVKDEVSRIHKKRKTTPNISLTPAGDIHIQLTSYQKRSVNITQKQAASLRSIHRCHPFQLVIQKATRNTLNHLVSSGAWTICPNAKAAIQQALNSYNNNRVTLAPLNPIQCLGWIDDADTILCTQAIDWFQKGQRYAIESKTITFLKTETRPCIIQGKRTKETVKVEGNDLEITITGKKPDGTKDCIKFLHIPERSDPSAHDLTTLAAHFEIPHVPDVTTSHPAQYQANLDKLKTLLLAPYQFKKFQAEDLARAACVDGLIFGHVQGLGKSLAAFAYPMLKDAKRTLIVCPGGLIKQFRETAANFYGKPLTILHDIDDLKRWKLHQPPSPHAPAQFFITSYEALTRNGGDEWEPKLDNEGQPIITKRDKKRIIDFRTWAAKQAFARLTGTKYDPTECYTSIGRKIAGITCIWKPTMASLLAIYEGQGAGFDCLALDEATRLQSSTSQTACGIRKLNPKYRILLTGTPIKNKVDSVFHLLHYAAGGHPHPTAQFPFTSDSESRERFANLHLEKDRFITREQIKKSNAIARGEKYNSKVIKRSSRICNIHHLWKLMAPTIIRRRKDDCNEDIVEKTIRPIIVKPGTAQLAVYGHHLDNAPIAPKGSPRARLNHRAALGYQLNILRQVALSPDDPSFEDIINGNHRPLKTSWTPWTPKLATTMTLISKLLSEGEQVVIGSPYRHFNETLHNFLKEAKVPSLLLDGTTTPAKRGLMVRQFKNKVIPIIIAGIKAMGEGHSLECCSHLILPSYSWAFDENDQFIDRIWRLNSTKPVTVYPIITEGTIDELMASNYSDKKDSSQLALDGRILSEQVDDIDPEILLADAYDKYRSNPESTDEEPLEEGWPTLRKTLTIANRLYNEFHPPITHAQVTPDDLINVRHNLQPQTKEEAVAIAKARVIAKIKHQQKTAAKKRK